MSAGGRIAAGAALAFGAVLSSGASAQAVDYHGCTPDYACIYPGTSWSGGPEHRFATYGVHKIYNEYGRHLLYNNQINGALMWLCTDGAGKSCPYYINAQGYPTVDLTPYNSIKLTP